MPNVSVDSELYKLFIRNLNGLFFEYNVDSDEIVFYGDSCGWEGKNVIGDYTKKISGENAIYDAHIYEYIDFLKGRRKEPVEFLKRGRVGGQYCEDYRWYEISGEYTETADGARKTVGTIRSVRREEKYTDNTRQRKSCLDSDTGLIRRTLAEDVAEKYINGLSGGEYGSVIMVDMDNFTDINDAYGVKFADAVLSEAAGIMKRIFGCDCMLTRLGGDEFLILAYGRRAEEMKTYAERLRESIAALYSGENERISVSASISVVDNTDSGDYFTMYDYAQTVISYIKALGGNRTATYKEACAALGKPVERLYHKRNISIDATGGRTAANEGIAAYAMTLLEDAEDMESSMNLLLEKIGAKYGAARVSVTSVSWETLSFRYAYGWSADGSKIRKSSGIKLTIREYYIMSTMYNEQGLCEREGNLQEGGNGSALEAAIYNKGKYAGALRIEKDASGCKWSDGIRAEMILLAGIIGTYMNRYEGEKDLERKQFELKVMSTAINGGFKVMLDDRDRTLTEVSDELCALLGYSKKEFLEITDGAEINMIYPEDLSRVLEETGTDRIHDADSYTIKYRVRCKNGELKWLLDSGSRLVDGDNRSVFYSACIDITETENASERIRELYKQSKATEEFIRIALGNTKTADFYCYPADKTCVLPERSSDMLGCGCRYENMPYDFVEDIVDPEMQGEVIDAYNSIVLDGKTTQCVFKRKNTDIWIKITLSSVQKDDNPEEAATIVGIAEDISDETNLAQERTRIIESISDTYFAMYHIKIKDGTFTAFKQREDVEELIGQTGEYTGFIDRYAENFVAPEYREGLKRFVSFEYAAKTLSENNRIDNFEYQRIFADHVGWVRASIIFESETDGEPDSFMLALTDINEAMLREQEQRKEHKLLSFAISDSYDSIHEIQLENDEVYEVAQENGVAVRRKCPNTYTETAKKRGKEEIYPDDRDIYLKQTSIEYLDQMITKDKMTLYQEFRIKEGKKYIWKSFTYRFMPDADGKTLMRFESNIDERKRHEIEVQEALKSAFDSAKNANAAKSDFLSKMSHDIRTPMNAIIGMTAIAGAHIEDKEKVADCLGKITSSSKHLLNLINEVLDMSKIESGKMDLNEDDVNLSDLVEELITMIQPQVEGKHHTLRVNLNGVVHEDVIGDSLRLQQVFVNLLSNAVKYTREGGLIELIIAELPCRVPEMGMFEFTFRDNGMGMTKEFAEHIFDPFARAEDSRISKIQGTGLGMAITKNIVGMMNGDITVKSELNKGSEFKVTVYLKLRDTDAEDIEELHGMRVLVVDDDASVLESTCGIIEDLGMMSNSALGYDEAVKLVEENKSSDERYFAALIDWKMPKHDGIETARKIKEISDYDIPVIIISSYDWSYLEDDAQTEGIDRFIAKPLFKSRLVRAFREFIGDSGENKNEMEEFEKTDFSGKRILLVEDNEINLEIATEVISYTGADIENARNGAEAVKKVDENEVNYYDMVFMDVQMPIMDGYEATRTIRKLDRPDAKTLPIVAMTASAFANDVKDAKNAGMNDHLAKPIDFGKLLKVMNEWLK